MNHSAHSKKQDSAIIKKYPNRRLYDTQTSAYITLEDLCDRVKKGDDFKVVDAKSGVDLTNQVLTQIILDQEIKGSHLLPTEFLRLAIRFYDNNKMGGVLQHYLDASMKSFVANQDRVSQMFGKEFQMPIGQLEELARQNMTQGAQFMEKTMQMFNPFGQMFGAKSEPEEEAAPAKAKRAKRV